ncbi:uncharacterized protein YndB with AHSA1/START domain [Stackebrandtia albiflava]|uniref:Uncharacterized protein YndB with AHSA1/START domain n=1 Tax=Stackebrandtia albiflava TaxID=406432 RepID=A0A562VDG0_9ACTN|nr:SRPBCC domain-containing protein [Stackebrandtia albiflava]TWJ15902.1 uncharacterized protein YndB with AHSA1/START domain [Stackebrandtia albiflava]
MSDTTTTADGRPAVRLERRLPHPVATVWDAVTDPRHLSAWYPLAVVSLQPHVGGGVVFDDGEGTRYDATITDYTPPTLFAFDEHDPESPGRENDDHLRITLRPDADGCVLVLTHVPSDPDTVEGAATGWRGCLDALAAALR